MQKDLIPFISFFHGSWSPQLNCAIPHTQDRVRSIKSEKRFTSHQDTYIKMVFSLVSDVSRETSDEKVRESVSRETLE